MQDWQKLRIVLVFYSLTGVHRVQSWQTKAWKCVFEGCSFALKHHEVSWRTGWCYLYILPFSFNSSLLTSNCRGAVATGLGWSILDPAVQVEPWPGTICRLNRFLFGPIVLYAILLGGVYHGFCWQNRPYHGFWRHLQLTDRQSGQKLQCLHGNPIANNLYQNWILHNLWIATLIRRGSREKIVQTKVWKI